MESSVVSAENTNTQQVVVPQGVSEEADNGITLMDLLTIIRKHIVTAIIAFVVVVAGVSTYTFLSLPKYTATAQTMATYNASQEGADISQQSTGGNYIISNQYFQSDHLIPDTGHHRKGAQARHQRAWS